jgi:hypothetical protein
MRGLSTHSLFDLDPTLPAVERKEKPRKITARVPKARRALPPGRKLPRLDPEGVALANPGGVPLLAVAIERKAPLEDGGSVLLLDVGGILDGAPPRRLDRRVVGANAGARPETLQFTADGRLLMVACEQDGGTLTFLEIDGSPPAVRASER